MHTGMKLNDGKIYVKGEDGEVSELGVVKGITSVEVDSEGEFTYGNAKVLEGESTTLSLPLTHKEWYKKRKGKRWVNYFITKPGLDYDKITKFLGWYCQVPVRYIESKNLKFGLSKKKPRGKLAKEHGRMYKYTIRHLNDHYVDYTECYYPHEISLFKPEDNAKMEAIVTKRIDELKGEE